MGNRLILLKDVIKKAKEDSFSDTDDASFFEYFVSKEILKNHDLNVEEIEAGLSGGTNDGGIDAIFFFIDDQLIHNEEDEVKVSKHSTFTLHFIQASRADGFKEDAILKLKDSFDYFFDLSRSSINSHANSFNETVFEKISNFQHLYRKHSEKFPKLIVNIHYATFSEGTVHPKVENKAKQLRDSIIQKIDSCTVHFNFLGADQLYQLVSKVPKKTLKLEISGSTITTSAKDSVCLVELKEYYKFISEDDHLIKNIFESNVRDYQGKIEVNNEIMKTLKNSDEEGNFWWLNNGITIVCNNFRLTGNEMTIEDPQIVNGLQTSYQIFEFFKTLKTENNVKRHVLIRIIKPENASIRDKIIRATNSQSAIIPSQLRATHEVHRDIEAFFAKNDLYYDRRKNYYINAGKPRNSIIGISALAQAVNAILLHRPDLSRAKPASLIKNDENYKAIFKKTYNLALYLNIAKMMMRVEKFIKSDQAKKFSKDLKYHLAMYAVAKKIGKVKPTHHDFIMEATPNLDTTFLLDCLTKVDDAIRTLRKGDDPINKIVKTIESVASITNLLNAQETPN